MQSIFVQEYVPKKVIWAIFGGFGVIELFVYGFPIFSLLLLALVVLACTTHYRLDFESKKNKFVSYIWLFGLKISKSYNEGVPENIVFEMSHNKYGPVWEVYLKFTNGNKLFLIDNQDKSALISEIKPVSEKFQIQIID